MRIRLLRRYYVHAAGAEIDITTGLGETLINRRIAEPVELKPIAVPPPSPPTEPPKETANAGPESKTNDGPGIGTVDAGGTQNAPANRRRRNGR